MTFLDDHGVAHGGHQIDAEQLVLGAIGSMPGMSALVFDGEFRFRAVFGAAVKAHGHDPEQMVGRRAPDVLPAAVWRRLAPLYARVTAGETFTTEIESGDRSRVYETTFSPVLGADRADRGDGDGARGHHRTPSRWSAAAPSNTSIPKTSPPPGQSRPSWSAAPSRRSPPSIGCSAPTGATSGSRGGSRRSATRRERSPSCRPRPATSASAGRPKRNCGKRRRCSSWPSVRRRSAWLSSIRKDAG